MQLNELWGRYDSQEVKGPIEGKGLSQEGIIDLLGEEDNEEEVLDIDEKEDDKEEEKEEEKEDKEEKDEEDEEDKEDKKDEEDDEDKLDETELDLVAPHKKKEILKEFPTLFKKFPYIEQAYYGYQQFVEVFPTVEDAKEALQAVNVLNHFEKDVMAGSTEKIIKAIKSDQKAFTRLVDDYLPTLHRVDPDAATYIVTNIYKNAIYQMAQTAEDNKDEDLKEAVLKLNEFLFNSKKITPPTKLNTKVDDSAEKALAEERRNMAMQRFDEVQGDLQQKVDNSIRATIAANIDKKGTMSAFEKKHAVNEAFDLLEKTLLANKPFRGQMDQLWKAAFASNYSRSTLENIRSAFFSKARTVLPDVIRRARAEALKGKGRKQSSDDDDKDRRGHLPVGRHSSGGNTKEKEEKESKRRGESTLDYFNRR